MSTYYFCLEALPLGDAVTLFFFNPCITAVAAAVFLKEPLGLKGVMGVVTSIGGLVILAHPPFLFGGHEGWGMQRKLGTMFGIISALFAAGAFISIR